MQPENQMISLAELQDLMTRLEGAMDLRSDRWQALKVTLAWAGEHQLLTLHPEPEIRLDLPKLTIPVPPTSSQTERQKQDFADAIAAARMRQPADTPVIVRMDPTSGPDEADTADMRPGRVILIDDTGPSAVLGAEIVAALFGEPVPETAAKPAPRKPYTPKPGPAKAAYAKPEDAKPVAPAAPVSDPEMHAHLNALGCKAPWTPALDLELAEGLAKGILAEVLADQLGIEAFRCRDRFKALLADFAPIEGQKRLLAALRERARK
jgi:hypothetical protein